MQVLASSGQVIRLDMVTDQIGVVNVDIDRPRISICFFGASEALAENHCVLSTALVLQMDGSYALSVQFRIPFAEQGVDGETDVEGSTSVEVTSEIAITGAVTDARVEVI